MLSPKDSTHRARSLRQKALPTTSTEFLRQLLDIDSLPDQMFVQHNRPEYQFPLHEHQKGQFLYVEEGVASLITPTRRYFVPARHYVWIPPGMAHYPVLSSPRSLLHSLCFPTEGNQQHPFFSVMGIYPVTTLLYEMLHFTSTWHGHIGSDDVMKFTFLRALQLALPAMSPPALPLVLPTTDDDRLQGMLAHLHQHLAEPLTLAALAQQFGFSLRGLSRLFQQRLRLSFGQYLKISRVIAAMELMLQSQKSISEIAYLVGYNSLSAFSHAFHQLVNCRPTEFALQVRRRGTSG